MPARKKSTSKKTTKKRTVKKRTTTRKSSVSSEVIELRSQMESLRKQMTESAGNRLENNIEDLSEQLNKMVSININLQSKMTELLIKVTDLIRENRELISLLEEASETEVEEAKGPDWESLLVELKKIVENTNTMGKSNDKLAGYIKRLYTKRLLTKAIKGKIEDAGEEAEDEVEEENLPLPEEGGNIGAL